VRVVCACGVGVWAFGCVCVWGGGGYQCGLEARGCVHELSRTAEEAKSGTATQLTSNMAHTNNHGATEGDHHALETSRCRRSAIVRGVHSRVESSQRGAFNVASVEIENFLRGAVKHDSSSTRVCRVDSSKLHHRLSVRAIFVSS
jgi:hypothetical protein